MNNILQFPEGIRPQQTPLFSRGHFGEGHRQQSWQR